ncbi:hypothetical protein [uncultured Polaribacter sp.]|uniref:hypothetical protein n=1 Tax=uncultured Polaribacter sp. TaxID=174711 RepID=UPI002623C526|nr:hypothetical protein [uncultured Polaribacter sp.]
MGFLKKLYNNIKVFMETNLNKIKESKYLNKNFWGYTILYLLGNTIPIWFLLIINLIEKKFSCSVVIESIHQPFTYLVLSGTLLSTTLYLWLKSVKSNSENNSLPTSMLIFIFIFLPLLGYLFIKTNNKSIEEISLALSVVIYLIFGVSLLIYLFYQANDFVGIKKTNAVNDNSKGKEREKNEIDQLKKDLENLKKEDNV